MNDQPADAVAGRLAAGIAMSQTSARLAYAHFLSTCPPPPAFGSDEHKGMVQGKDASVAMAIAGLFAEHRHGTLKHFTADDIRAVGAIMVGMDSALSRRLGVDVEGNTLT